MMDNICMVNCILCSLEGWELYWMIWLWVVLREAWVKQAQGKRCLSCLKYFILDAVFPFFPSHIFGCLLSSSWLSEEWLSQESLKVACDLLICAGNGVPSDAVHRRTSSASSSAARRNWWDAPITSSASMPIRNNAKSINSFIPSVQIKSWGNYIISIFISCILDNSQLLSPQSYSLQASSPSWLTLSISSIYNIYSLSSSNSNNNMCPNMHILCHPLSQRILSTLLLRQPDRHCRPTTWASLSNTLPLPKPIIHPSNHSRNISKSIGSTHMSKHESREWREGWRAEWSVWRTCAAAWQRWTPKP